MGKLLGLFITTITLVFSSYACHASAKLSFCVENTEFPPFNYFERIDGIKQKQSAGYDIDILALTFKPIDVPYQVIALPWRRCLKSVKLGLIDAAMSASLNPERRADYLTSDAYYFLTPSFFYLDQTFTEQEVSANIENLNKLGAVCGIQGFNYVNFGWSNSEELNEIKELSLLPSMLAKKRCSFFLARKETLAGILALNDMNALEDSLIGKPIPHALPEPFHMLVSRRSKHAQFILQHFNQQIASLRTQEQLQPLLEKHLKQLQKR